MMMKKVLKTLKTLLICIFAAVLLTAAYFYFSPLLIRHNDVKAEGSASWMSLLPDDMLLSEISIPGTHDSATENVMLAYFAKCQASDIRTQLDDGFRYLDIRLGVKRIGSEDKLIFYHGFCPCREGWTPWSAKLELSTVLAQCYSFLSDYPSETIIFTVKMEQGSDLTSFELLLDSYISKGQDKWLLTDKMPALGECRGKIVLFRRYEDVCGLGKRAGIHMDWTDQGASFSSDASSVIEKQECFTLQIQDRYKLDPVRKWEVFTKGIEYSLGSDRIVSLSFLSTNGTARFGHPYSHAKDLNKLFLELDLSALKTRQAPDIASFDRSFWIITDFSDAELASHIYSINFQ